MYKGGTAVGSKNEEKCSPPGGGYKSCRFFLENLYFAGGGEHTVG